MRLNIKNILDLPEFRNTHELQRFRIPFLRMALNTRGDNKRGGMKTVLL